MFRSNVAVALFVTNVFNVVTRGGARGTGWDGLCIVFYGPKRDGIWGTYDLGTPVIEITSSFVPWMFKVAVGCCGAQVAEVSPKQPDMEATAAISLLR
jgi:hypothetical protein